MTLRRPRKPWRGNGKASSHWRKQVAAVARLYARIAEARNDAIHKATAAIAQRAGRVAVETLNVRGMTRKRRWARALRIRGRIRAAAASAPGTARPCARLTADPSSQLRHPLRWRNEALTLALRQCGGCGVRVDRDANAAADIRNDATAGNRSTAACGDCARPSRDGGGQRRRNGKVGPAPATRVIDCGAWCGLRLRNGLVPWPTR